MSKRRNLIVLIDLGIFISVSLVTRVISFFSTSSVLLPVQQYVWNVVIFLCALLIARANCGVYLSVWRYADSKVYLCLIIADLLGGLVALGITWIVSCYVGVWQAVANVTLFNIGTLFSRFLYQQRYRYVGVELNHINKIGVAIVGAGQTGVLLAEELLFGFNKGDHPISKQYRPVCFVDQNKDKVGQKIHGLPVYSSDEGIIKTIQSLPVQEIFIALYNLGSEETGRLYDFYSQTGCAVKLYDFPLKDIEPQANQRRVLREINIEDLLFRDSLTFESMQAKSFYQDKVVLVTGGGGSIGSELCRQIAKRKPARLIIFDIYENNAYDIQQELIAIYGNSLALEVEIGSIRDRTRLETVFRTYHPEVVFHAAAHKHVPLMEQSGCEAVKNNVIGTYNTADMAEKFGVDRFILISTDKAVNPTNIMGASKRMCEMVVQCRTDSKTSFGAVRFGNVLGSNGSVVPLFQKQILEGGPVTLTDKRIIRYFMTIPEASQLVMRAGAMAKRGELFVLDMGKPVKILDLAENLIRLSGYQPYQDIDIVEIGLRPGEKLYEELLLESETLSKTEDNMIFIEHDEPLTRQEVECRIKMLTHAVERCENRMLHTGTDASDILKEAMKRAVPTYCDPHEVNGKAAYNLQDAEESKSETVDEEGVLTAV